MVIFRLLKHRFTPTLITLLISLLMTACSSEGILTAADPDIYSETTTENGSTTTEIENNVSTDITLAWVAPVEREDNSALSLTAIAGYKVYFGNTQGQYSKSLSVSDGSATGYTFNGFAAGTYYFVITTIDNEGRESQYSSEITITT